MSKPRGVVTAALAPRKPVYGRSGIRHERWTEFAKETVEGNVVVSVSGNPDSGVASVSSAVNDIQALISAIRR
jgi:hypothetical protein